MVQTKFLIVGQGLAGTLLSHQFTKNKVKHLLIGDRNKPAASKVAAGMYNPLVFKRLTKSWMVDQLLPDMYAIYDELEQLLGVKLLHNVPIAKLMKPNEEDWWNKRIESQQLQLYFDKFLETKSIHGINPEYKYALLKNSGYVDLNTLINQYANHLLEHKQLRNQAFDYNKLKQKNGYWNYEDINAEQVIFCEGPFANANPYFSEIQFYLTKGQVLRAKIKELPATHIINKDVFILPKGNNEFIIGSTYEHENVDWVPNDAKKNYLLEKAQSLIQLPIAVLSHQAGVRPTIKDRRPVLGTHPQYNSLHVFNGLGTKGVMIAPYFSKIMLKYLMNELEVLPKEVDYFRFLHA